MMKDYEQLLEQIDIEPPEPRDSAVGIVLRRGTAEPFEILVGLRSHRSRFMPGHWAFIGGRIEPEDEPEQRGYYARCVSRELEEETGLRIPPAGWQEAGTRITPPTFPVRYHTRFLAAWAPDGASLPDSPPRPEELDALRFIGAGELLREWEAGIAHLPPVLPPVLRWLAARSSSEAGRLSLAELAARIEEINTDEQRLPRIEFVPDIWLAPMRSRTLPPATHTNAWIVGGRAFVIFDPGSGDKGEIDRLVELVERRCQLGHRPLAVLLTHHHPDHVGGATAVSTVLDLPVWAHAQTLERVRERLDDRPTRQIGDGDVLGLDGMTLRALWTPGHASGHLAFYVPERRVAVVGDLVSGFSTMIIDPSEGSMACYLDSLARVADLDCRLLLPAHGPPLPPKILERTRRHRLMREKFVLSGVGATPTSLETIADKAYADVPAVPAWLKQRQALSHLIHLEEQGRVCREGKLWSRVGDDA
ncbi:MAG: MBL fold metallo-hydrolase [Acidobacteriota bacterium]|nr:MAG: MBL fold metallo-hydrolase [Acidobacteriota bacterium]